MNNTQIAKRLVIATILIAFISCKKNDKTHLTSYPISGGWELRSLSTTQISSTTPPTTQHFDTLYAVGTFFYLYLRQDSTYTISLNYSLPPVDSGTYILTTDGKFKMHTYKNGTLYQDTTNITVGATSFVITDTFTNVPGQLTTYYSATWERR